MAQKFTTNCDFAGKKIPVTLYIGNPSPNSHPLAFQEKWLSKEKGGNIPNEIMESFTKLKKIADNSKIPFEELCKYVVDELNASSALEKDFNKASQLSKPKEENE
ncbi:MAG: DUF2610 domain-containing protein [Proteobacteria bacterium]|nr:DUF2610 domain-containing protein [Pseudomonadota bacterium]